MVVFKLFSLMILYFHKKYSDTEVFFLMWLICIYIYSKRLHKSELKLIKILFDTYNNTKCNT